MADQPLGICLLSCVRHQGGYAPLYANHPALRIVCVADEPDVPDWVRSVNQTFAEQYQVPYLPITEALRRPEVKLVSICSEPTRHARLAIQAAQAGVHVLVDKPIATTVADARRVVEAVQQSGIILTYIHHLFNPALEQARQLIDSGRLAVPWAFHIDLITGGGLDSGFVEDFALVVNPALSGGGEIMNFLNYAIGYLRFLTGLEVESVYALAGTYFFEPHQRFGVEDLGLVALNLERGVTATVTVGRIPAQLGSAAGSFTLRGQGLDGLFLLDQFQPRLAIDKRPGQAPTHYPPLPAQPTDLEALLADLIRAIQGGPPPRCGPEDGLAITSVVEAVYRSLASGAVEQL
jgi:myo-inositol 2-dehydrogenase / D-chiro-inositol 1-dehydrogenase